MLHQIGVGALGPVFRTYEPTRDRLVAVKVFRLDLTPEQAESLAEELSKATEAGLFHSSIVEPVAAGVEGTVAYRAEEYVAAESLDVAMRHYAPATLEKALPFITQLAAAIDFARAAGVGHGALHPRDIFVTPDEARATGFGVVDALERLGQRAPVRRPYSPPERIAGSEWGSPADVFSLAVIAFELLTGRRPAGIGEQMGTLAGAALGDRADAIKAVLAKAMDESAAARYQTAGAFAAALAEAAGNPSLAVGAAEAAAVTGGSRLLASDDLAIEPDDSGRDETGIEALEDFAPDAPPLEAGESPREAARKAIAARKRLMKDKPPPVEFEATAPIADVPLPLAAAMDPGAAVDLEVSPIPDSSVGEPVSPPIEEPQAAPAVPPIAPVASSPTKSRAREPRTKKHDREHLFKPLDLPVAPPLPDVAAPAIDRLAPEAVMPPVEGESIEPRREEPRIDVLPQGDAEPVTESAEAAKDGEGAIASAAASATSASASATSTAPGTAELDEPMHPGVLASDLDAAPASPAREVELGAYGSEGPAHVDEPMVRARGDEAMTDAPLLRDVSDRVVAVDEFRARESASPRGDRAWPRLSERPTLDRSLASNPSPIEPSEPAEQPAMFGVEEPRRDRSPRAMLPYAVPLIVGLLLGYMVRDFIGDRNQAREPTAVSDTGTTPNQAPGTPATSGQAPAGEATEHVVTPSAASAASSSPPPSAAPAPSTPAAAKDAARRDPPPPPAKPRAAAPRTGTIVVNSNPSKAGVTVNGRWMGRTPLRLRERRFGKYSVRVVQAGFETERQDFSLSAAAATKTIDVSLKRQPSKTPPKPAAAAAQKPAASTGEIFVDSRPQGARVLIDGREVGVTPFRLPGVTVGSYAVRLELVDHTPWTATTKVAAGETARVTGSLDRIR